MNETRIALITGASRGFGRSMAAHLTADGVSVIGTYNRSATAAEQLTEEVAKNDGKLAFLHLDVSRAELFQEFADRVKRVLNDWGHSSSTTWSTTQGSAISRHTRKLLRSSSTNWSTWT